MTIGPTTSRSAHAMVMNGSIPFGKNTWTTLTSVSMMTTVQAANNVMLSVALVPRRAAVLREVPVQEVAVLEAAPRVVALPQGNRTVVAVEPVDMMTMISIHHVVVVEAAGDNFLCHKTDKTIKTIVVGTSNGSQPLAVATPTKVGH